MAHDGMITSLHFHPLHGSVDFSDLFLTSSVDWTVKLWKAKSPLKTASLAGVTPPSASTVTPLCSFEESDDYVYDAKWSPTHPALFACVDGSGMLDVYDLNSDLEESRATVVVGNTKSALNKVAWDKAGTRTAVGSSDGTVCEMTAPDRTTVTSGLPDDLLEDETFGNMFEEPEHFRPPTPEGTYEDYHRVREHVSVGTPEVINLHMIGRHSLWAHRIWNAGIVLARHLDADKSMIAGKRVLELGCAASLPSLISALGGAEKVVATDYPDPHLLKSIRRNCSVNAPRAVEEGRLEVVGYQWGQDLVDVLAALPDSTRKFDVIFMADLIFNHTEQRNLVKSCKGALEPKGGVVYVYFTSHVVKWQDRDMKFFEIAVEEEFNFAFEKISEVKASAMFPDDVGDLSVRETVNCYKLWLK
ncbi:hypothetical protein BC830DRAFT_1228136 [Chytriomyces sp. MP71]|nr:hypothetical protein BC830DRAFT_1228136 [Chytriomyces sp. MP71]